MTIMTDLPEPPKNPKTLFEIISSWCKGKGKGKERTPSYGKKTQMHDSVKTSVYMKLFSSEQDALVAHAFAAASSSKIQHIPLATFSFQNVINFDSDRLRNSAEAAYPPHNRPRGHRDVCSVNYHVDQLSCNHSVELSPIWLLKTHSSDADEKYTLLDGAHRIVASYIEKILHIPAYVIDNPLY